MSRSRCQLRYEIVLTSADVAINESCLSDHTQPTTAASVSTNDNAMIAPPRNEEHPDIHNMAQHDIIPKCATTVTASNPSTTKVASSGQMLDKVHTKKDAGVNVGLTRGMVLAIIGYGLHPASAGTHTYLLTITISCSFNCCTVLKDLLPGLSYVCEPERNELRLAEEGHLYALHCEELTPSSPVGCINVTRPIILAVAVSTLVVQYAFGMCIAYTGGAFVLFVVGSVVVSEFLRSRR